MASGVDFEQTARRLLHEHALPSLLCRGVTERDALESLAHIDTIYSDVDGTVVSEGATALPKRMIDCMRHLAEAGICLTLVSGKPYEEVVPLLEQLPLDLAVPMLYEKGAYLLERAANGSLQQSYVCGSKRLEAELTDVRQQFLAFQQQLQRTYSQENGRQGISFGWAGTGTHRSLLSIDIFAGSRPEAYQSLVGVDRDDYKLHDPRLLAAIITDIETFIASHLPGWHVVNLGNANIEISPASVEKDLAIKQTATFQRAQGVLVLGDSGNDQAMFALHGLPKVLAGLVLHDISEASLMADVDFITFGMANPYPLFDALVIPH